MGIQTVAVYSDVDRDSCHVRMADAAYRLGAAPSIDSYLNKEKIIDIALRSNADAVHPGYGFLSENVEFADQCARNNIIFIGPPFTAIRDMGIKSTSKAIMSAAGVPVVPGYHGDNQDDHFLFQEAKNIGFPVMIKAVRGGGGKGMRISHSADDFLEQLESARREASKSFGDDAVLIEKFVENPRHVEVQVFGDTLGNYVYLFERDCSVQRRHQKIIEEAPAPGINESIRKQLGEAAVKAAKAVNYVGAGTVEFIFDPKNEKFYFMEMNTRLQVEHPITEMITDTDLVEWQLRVAGGEPLPMNQSDIKLRGHAFEARIYAEDPENNFLPGAGPLIDIHTPAPENGIRIETGVRSGDEVSVHYDPMIAKLVVWEKDRISALRKLNYALTQYNIVGLKTNTNFLIRLSLHPSFIDGDVHTNFIEDHKHELFPSAQQIPVKNIVAAAIGFLVNDSLGISQLENGSNTPFSKVDFARLHNSMAAKHQINLKVNNAKYKVEIISKPDNNFSVKVNDCLFENISLINFDNQSKELIIDMGNEQLKQRIVIADDIISLFTSCGSYEFEFDIPNYFKNAFIADSDSATSLIVTAPISGVVEKLLVASQQAVKTGETVAILMAMKMEYVIKASQDCVVDKILVNVGDNVGKGSKLIEFAIPE
ncbi:methylcrotonoyl-CoA carboxylase subunit alpha-like protein, partial [Dinothrombium tinctorium]